MGHRPSPGVAGGLLQVSGSAGSARGQGQRGSLPKQLPDVAQPHSNGHFAITELDVRKMGVCSRSLGTIFTRGRRWERRERKALQGFFAPIQMGCTQSCQLVIVIYLHAPGHCSEDQSQPPALLWQTQLPTTESSNRGGLPIKP